MQKKAVVITTNDSIATATTDLKAGEVAKMFFGKEVIEIEVRKDIPFGHKFAIKDIKVGEPVLKYGESIGSAITDINIGEHVHVHNIQSERGRGDRD
ncbi:UxaA family hydrolase [Cetobacterium sp.]|uniref:UxaA family hydrolase n=1 Tax=Cetobacterium sp. TaxID=2071632 RepID=UPI003F38EAD1